MADLSDQALLPWESIDTVLLDMDGTLLDRNFDDRFWLEHIPRAYAARHSRDLEPARKELFSIYAAQEGTLNWTDIHYWSARLDLDVEGLKEDLGHLVALHPFAREFLQSLRRARKQVWLATNAHPATLKFKMSKIEITQWFHGILTSQYVGCPKEDPAFWELAGEHIGYDRERTLLADDTVAVLKAAQAHGIGHLLHISRFSSTAPAEPSQQFLSVADFARVMARCRQDP